MIIGHYCFLLILFIAIMFQKRALALPKADEIPEELTDYMATREMRYHHFLWHNIRNEWFNLDDATRSQITNLGWAPPRPAYKPDGTPDRDNGSGEDFLYMHRKMIADANNILKKYGKQVTGFTKIPAPGDTDYPVPTGFLNDPTSKYKTDDYYWTTLKPAEDKYTNPTFLKTLTLAQLGSRLEFIIHNPLHQRFANKTAKGRPSTTNVMPYIDKKWDYPNYTYLGDTYASHVDAIFWKIHGWVDQRIEDWKNAKNIDTIQWSNTWVGGTSDSIDFLLDTQYRTLAQMHNHHNMKTMEKVMELVLKSSKCTYYCCFTQKLKKR